MRGASSALRLACLLYVVYAATTIVLDVLAKLESQERACGTWRDKCLYRAVDDLCRLASDLCAATPVWSAIGQFAIHVVGIYSLRACALLAARTYASRQKALVRCDSAR